MNDNNRTAVRLSLCFLLAALFSPGVYGQANHVVISEVYGGGGNSGSTWKNDFVELYNPTNVPVDVTGWSVQYGSYSGAMSQVTMLTGTIQPKSFFLVQESQGAGGTKDLPTPDVVGVIPMASGSGKVALVRDSSLVSSPNDPTVVDFIGYGSANQSEGSPAPLLTNTTSAERKASATSTDATLAPGGSEEKAGNGWDTNNNGSDFVAQLSINPQNSASAKEPPASILSGIGTAVFVQQVVKADTAVEVWLTLQGSPAGAISALRFPKNQLLDWSRSNVTATSSRGTQLTVNTTVDSVLISAFSISAGDSLQVHMTRLSAQDTTVKVVFAVETGPSLDLTSAVTPLPTFVLYGNPRPIANVRGNDAQGVPVNFQKPITVRGIVTVASQFGGPAYLQDVSGGLAAFDLNFESAVSIGDEVTITGTVTQYNGLTELANVTLHKIDSKGNEVVPVLVTASQIARDGAGGVEVYEGMLVQLNGVTIRDTMGRPITSWTTSTASGSNFRLFDATDSMVVRIDGDLYTQFNIPAPTGEFDIVGVVGQFISTSPYVGGYQLMPRSIEDVFSKGPVITVAPLESMITPDSFDIKWETAKPGTSYARYGRTKAYELGITGAPALETIHRFTVSGLSPAKAYHLQAFSVSGIDTSFAGDRVISTASQGSTGQMNVYFNKSIDPSVARRDTAGGNADLTGLLIRRINGARKSIDCALYSLSGQVGQSIANALVQARGRGVNVRFIIEKDNMSAGTGTTANQVIIPGGIPWIMDDFDAANAGVGLQHNKFFIFDYQGGSSDQTWVWTGSWNPTDPGTNDDVQNSIEIQDQALAGAYTIEFNEMWGSETNTPDPANSRFGARKLDNTPHIFNINGVPVELYFSPSDRTTSHIISALDKAQNSINMALLTLTRSDIATELKSKKIAGRKVRGILDNNTDTGSQFAFLASSGIEMRVKPSSVTGLFHHKYAVIHAELTAVAQYVITGSHNWTSAAESSNNENTLIIQSNSIANQYLQEFVARYKSAGGSDNIVVNVERIGDQTPRSFSLAQNYPNPFNGTTNFEFQIAEFGYVTLRIYDVLGREVATLVQGEMSPGLYRIRWDADVSSGVYYCALRAGQSGAIRPMVVVK